MSCIDTHELMYCPAIVLFVLQCTSDVAWCRSNIMLVSVCPGWTETFAETTPRFRMGVHAAPDNLCMRCTSNATYAKLGDKSYHVTFNLM